MVLMDVAVKRKVGRPSNYRPELCDDLIKFFSRPVFIKEKVRKFVAGEEIIFEEKVANETPFLIHWSRKHGLHPDAHIDWAKNHPEFCCALITAKRLQEAFLAELGLKNKHNAFMSYQTLKNVSGWRDQKPDEKNEELINQELEFKDIPKNGEGISRFEKFIRN